MTSDAMRWSPEPAPVVEPLLRIDLTALASDPEGARRHLEDTIDRALADARDRRVTSRDL